MKAQSHGSADLAERIEADEFRNAQAKATNDLERIGKAPEWLPRRRQAADALHVLAHRRNGVDDPLSRGNGVEETIAAETKNPLGAGF